MKIKFDETKIIALSRRRADPKYEGELTALKDSIVDRGFLSIDDLRLVSLWKSPRSAHYIQENTNDYIREITAFALRSNNEQARIESLTILRGVSWPIASAVLHWFHRDEYPILDFRALWAFSETPKYSFAFWWRYVEVCRALADRNRVDMRTLDKALWQFSKENQPRSRE